MGASTGTGNHICIFRIWSFGILVGGGHVFIPYICHILDVYFGVCLCVPAAGNHSGSVLGLSLATAQEGGSMQSADSFCSPILQRRCQAEAQASYTGHLQNSAWYGALYLLGCCSIYVLATCRGPKGDGDAMQCTAISS